jgi:hypothetical protein
VGVSEVLLGLATGDGHPVSMQRRPVRGHCEVWSDREKARLLQEFIVVLSTILQ